MVPLTGQGAGEDYFSGLYKDVPGEEGKKYLRAIDVRTGRIVWEYPQTGDGKSWGGVLTTAGGLMFFADDNGALVAADAWTGHPLWHFQTSQWLRASPMTYLVDGTQYVALAAGPNILAFRLYETASAKQTNRIRSTCVRRARRPRNPDR